MSGIETVALIASIAGTAVSAVGAIAQGQQAADAAEFNAAVAQNEAIQARQEAAFQESQHRKRARSLLASQRAAVGASGTSFTGSPLSIMADSAAEAEIDAMMIRRSGTIAAANARARAAAERMDARAQRTAGLFNAGSSLLTGSVSVLDKHPEFFGG